ncbi:MAG: SEL1-like repeat protein [Bacteroidales bacterium]|nr:SEL1-like repeat protein [Bacteroidales bacterium]
MGVSYENGEGVPKNIKKAKEWYSKAAAQGLEQAEEALKNLNKIVVIFRRNCGSEVFLHHHFHNFFFA